MFYAVAIPAVILLGLGKGGFTGIGQLSVPMIALVISPVQAAAITLPLLIVQDAVGIWAFRRDWDARLLGWALPGAIVGIGLGYWFAARVTPEAVLAAVGLVSLLYGGWQLFRRWLGHEPVARRLPKWVGIVAGGVSGFTSQIAHAGAPPFQLWLLPMRLARDAFVGTTAIFFGVVNLVKLVPYWALGQFSATNLTISATLLPVAIVSTFLGVWLVRRVDPARFYVAIHLLLVLVGLELLREAIW